MPRPIVLPYRGNPLLEMLQQFAFFRMRQNFAMKELEAEKLRHDERMEMWGKQIEQQKIGAEARAKREKEKFEFEKQKARTKREFTPSVATIGGVKLMQTKPGVWERAEAKTTPNLETYITPEKQTVTIDVGAGERPPPGSVPYRVPARTGPTSAVRNYEYYKRQAQAQGKKPISFRQWKKENKSPLWGMIGGMQEEGGMTPAPISGTTVEDKLQGKPRGKYIDEETGLIHWWDGSQIVRTAKPMPDMPEGMR